MSESKRPQKNSSKKKTGGSVNPSDFYKYSGMAIKMGLVIFAGVYAGIALDEKLSMKTPWFTILLSLLSVGVAIYIVIKDTSS